MKKDSHQLLREIVAAPSSDPLRLEYASSIAMKDPDRARYINSAVQNPDVRGFMDVTSRIAGGFPDCHDVSLDRGFVERIFIDPYEFLRVGQSLLDSSPIRHVEFRTQPPGHASAREPDRLVPSPVPELVGSPLLKRLRSISFHDGPRRRWRFGESDLEMLLQCPHLDNLLWLKLANVDSRLPGEEWWKRFYGDARFRSLLHLEIPLLGADPAERAIKVENEWSDTYTTSPITALGRDLEAKHGYLPALHRLENQYSAFEATRRFERGQAPRFPVGAPITPEMGEQPIPEERPYNWA